MANKKFTSIPNDFCLTITENTIIEPCNQDKQISSEGFCFTSLAEIDKLHQNNCVDVIGVIFEVSPIGQINCKDGTSRDKRELTLGDDSKVSIKITLWGDLCHAHDYTEGQVIAFKSCRVSDFRGKCLNASNDPQDCYAKNIRHKRAQELYVWNKNTSLDNLKQEARSLASQDGGSQTPFMLIEELKKHCDESPEVQEGKPFYCKVKIEVQKIFYQEDRKMYYLACPTTRKKVVDDGEGYRCEACNETHQEANPTYVFNFVASDCSGQIILNLFGENGDAILGMKANDFYN